jgi:putative protease
MIDDIPALIQSGIDSFKIEGRMKTPYYVGTVIKAYRAAIDDYYNDPTTYEQNSKNGIYVDALIKSSHRDFTKGFYYRKPDGNEQVYTNNTYVRNYEFIGMVKDYDAETGIATVEQRNKFSVGEEIEILSAKGADFSQTVGDLWNAENEAIESAPHPQQMIKIKTDRPVKLFDMLRKRGDS